MGPESEGCRYRAGVETRRIWGAVALVNPSLGTHTRRAVPSRQSCGLSTLANYGEMTFDPGTANGGNPGLRAAEGGDMLLTGC
jgi:hypothetical protein